jgi:hypothetical protein
VQISGLIRHRCGLDFPIGTTHANPRSEHTGVHARLLARLGFDTPVLSEGDSPSVLRQAHARHPDAHFLIIGPARGVGRFLAGQKLGRLTMQGGFLPYSLYAPAVRLSAFEGQEWMPTFNFNGDRKAVDAILVADCERRSFVGKNVCHTVVFDAERWAQLAPARDPASELYRECMRLYLQEHSEKKFHDPTALVCHLHNEVGTWYAGRPVRREGGWTTEPGSDHVLADIDRERLWHHLLTWS